MALKVEFNNQVQTNELYQDLRPADQSSLLSLLYVHTTIPLLTDLLDSAPIQTSEEELLPETNCWSFFYWEWMRQLYSSVPALYAAIIERCHQISAIKELFRPLIEQAKSLNPLYADLSRLISMSSEASTYQLNDSSFFPIPYGGVSGSYFLTNADGQIRYVIKPLDEDAGCLHNPNGFATPLDTSPIRANMPLYLSCMREALTYHLANVIGVESVAPQTALAIFQSDQFHDLSEGVSLNELGRYLNLCGPTDREKLCSVQQYVPNSKSLFEALQDFQMAHLTDEEIAARFDSSDFEDANILLWTTYDTDGHSGNFLVYPKGVDAIGNEILGLKKIDNGLAFPDKNQQLRNNLAYLPNANLPLSESAKAKIANLNVDTLSALLKDYGLESAVEALAERIPYLQQLAQQPGITIREINRAMNKLDMTQ